MNQTTTLQALITKWGPLCKQHGISDLETVGSFHKSPGCYETDLRPPRTNRPRDLCVRYPLDVSKPHPILTIRNVLKAKRALITSTSLMSPSASRISCSVT